ncbi:MAG TPA: hypothetical protein VNE42_04195 [Acidimicrobiales bacterium]|nr:hypothetical protein [Acidimicrobiales bacterium]
MQVSTTLRDQTKGRAHRPLVRTRVGVSIVGLLMGSSVIFSGAVSASPARHIQAHKSKPTYKLSFNKKGVPNVVGMTISLGKGAGSPHIGDTVAYTAEQILLGWGATTSLTLGSATSVISGVIGGHLAATGGPFDGEINGGLTVFGPSQPGQNYEFIAQPKYKKLADLVGQTIAVTEPTDGDYVLQQLLSKKFHLTGKLTLEYTGTESNSLTSFIAGRIAGFWASSDSTVALKEQNVAYTPLYSARVLDPAEADSYEAATRVWLNANFAQAEAIDLAWLYAAKIFHTNETQWLANATAYTKGAFTKTLEALDYVAYRKENPWPASQLAFTPKRVSANFNTDAGRGSITKLAGGVPTNDYAVFGPWNAAVAAFNKHPNLFK